MRSMYSILSPENREKLCSSKIQERRSPNAGWERAGRDKRQPSRASSSSAASASSSRRKCRRVFRMRIRVTSRLHFLERLREMCVRLVLGAAATTNGSSSSSSKRGRCRNVCDSPKSDTHRPVVIRSSYCEDAVADCIKFIKQTAVAADSRSIIC